MKNKHFVTRLVTSASLIVVAVALVYCVQQYAQNQPEHATNETERASNEQSDAIEAFITERESVRKIEILQLNAVAADEDADASLRAQALSQLVRLTGYMEAETTLEGVLRMRGFEDAVVTVHADSVNVIVRAPTLSREESAIILELVMRETGQTGGNVKIMTYDKQ